MAELITYPNANSNHNTQKEPIICVGLYEHYGSLFVYGISFMWLDTAEEKLQVRLMGLL